MNTLFLDTIHKKYHRLKQCVYFLYEKLIKPRSGENYDHRYEFILNIILVGSIILLVIYCTLVIDRSIVQKLNYHGISFLFFICAIIITSGLLVLSHRGYFILASYATIALYFLGATYGAYYFGADLQGALLIYVVIIAVSSILISIRFGFLMTILISLTVMALWHFQITNVIAAQWYWKYEVRQSDSIIFVTMFFLIMLVSWLSNREMERSLARAQKSEADLKLERNSLEIKVEERTREIKTLQADKLAQLYRSAEFGKLSTGIFHDLMKPLTTVVSSISELDRNPEHLTEVKEYLEKAVSASRRLGDFLGTVRRQIKITTVNEIFSVNKELHEAVDILKYRAREVGVVLSIIDKKELFVFGNPLKFHQVVMNLISNAIDACESAKSVIHINLAKRDKFVQLKITDHGCGIPENLHEKIFDPFFTTKDCTKGMGLGLSTTKQIVEKDFNGTITFSSIENQGSTFTVLIPFLH